MSKTRFLIICIMVLFVILGGCKSEESSEGNSFIATVLENNKTSLLVEPVEGSFELRSADRIIVSVRDAELLDYENAKITIGDIKTGELVEIFYDGGIAESYPAQIQGCYRIRLLESTVDKTDNSNQKQTKTSDFTVKVGDNSVSLMTWDTEINLEEIFGKPLDIKVRQLGQDSDTFAGSYLKEVKFQGIEVELFSPKDNGQSFYVFSIKILDHKYETVRGIKVGDKLERLKELYPELMPILDGRKDDNNRGYMFEEGDYITFEIINGEIIEIRVYREFA
ncbi:MAG: hypothetical protein KGZ96_07610 [Clostridia bacterium]|nr:hypothetical protein [Clostridia bacterium]